MTVVMGEFEKLAQIEPLVLEGSRVRLEPVEEKHIAGLQRVIADGELWRLPVTNVPHPDDVPAFIIAAQAEQRRGEGLTFATIDRASGELAGSTRFRQAVLAHRRAEIGFTFIAGRWQRSHVNTEAKQLMLQFGFEALGLNRIEFLTDVRNDKSRAAIARVGARQEGVLRNHMVMRDGRIRDSVVFSITAAEWPELQRQLKAKLQAY